MIDVSKIKDMYYGGDLGYELYTDCDLVPIDDAFIKYLRGSITLEEAGKVAYSEYLRELYTLAGGRSIGDFEHFCSQVPDSGGRTIGTRDYSQSNIDYDLCNLIPALKFLGVSVNRYDTYTECDVNQIDKVFSAHLKGLASKRDVFKTCVGEYERYLVGCYDLLESASYDYYLDCRGNSSPWIEE